MLKKAGIVAAVATAGVLALSPLAFATDKGDYRHHGSDAEVTNIWVEDESLERDQVNRCEFEQEVDGEAAIAPITAVQDQSGNCVNAGDDSEIVEPAAPVLPLPLPIP